MFESEFEISDSDNTSDSEIENGIFKRSVSKIFKLNKSRNNVKEKTTSTDNPNTKSIDQTDRQMIVLERGTSISSEINYVMI
jgi:hypothetical protein